MADVNAKRVERFDGATLYLGDCLEVLPGLGAVDMVFMDPPYGHNNNDGDLISQRESALGRCVGAVPAEHARPIANDGPEANELIQKVFAVLRTKMAGGGCCCCCCCGGGPDPQFARWSLWLDEHFDFKQMVVWDKGPMGMGWHYRRSYETVLVGQVPGAACRWFGGNKIENVIRPGQYGIRKIIPSVDQHPTEKPHQLSAHFIRLHSEIRHTILDPFMGSGTTGVAALQLGRKFIGIEIDETYFDIACRRIDQASRQKDLFHEPPAAERAEQLPIGV